MRVQSRRYQRRLKRESAYFSAFFEICNLFYTHAKVLLYRSNTISQKTLVKHFGTLFFINGMSHSILIPSPPPPHLRVDRAGKRRSDPRAASPVGAIAASCKVARGKRCGQRRPAATSSASMMDWPRDFFSHFFSRFFSANFLAFFNLRAPARKDRAEDIYVSLSQRCGDLVIPFVASSFDFLTKETSSGCSSCTKYTNPRVFGDFFIHKVERRPT